MTTWKQIAERWRRLPEGEKRRIRLERIPRKVARSMAFAGEPVDEDTLERELARILQERSTAEERAPPGVEIQTEGVDGGSKDSFRL